MQWRKSLYALANALAPVAVVACLFLFAAAQYRLAWVCAFVVVLCMESRVQLGERLPHTAFFWTHLTAAVPFFLAFSTLAFFAQSAGIFIATICFGLITLATGAALWYRGFQSTFSPQPILALPAGNSPVRSS